MSTPTASSLPAPADQVNVNSLWTPAELAARWQVSKANVYRLAREGRIPTVTIGRYYRFRPAAILEWEQAREAAADV